jgi:hypothetical protein
MNFSTKTKTLYQQLLEKINEEDVFQYYFPFTLNKMYLSPFRKDNLPSFHITRNKEGNLFFHDFGFGGGNCIRFVELLFRISYSAAYTKILKDFSLNEPINKNYEKSYISLPKQEKKEYNIKFSPRKFNALERMYWLQYNITEEECLENEIWVPKSLFINDKKQYLSNELLFIYRFTKDGEPDKKKIYRPFNKEFKWAGSVSQKLIEGINYLPKISNIVLITSSRKDRIVLSHIFPDTVNTQNENEKAIIEKNDRFFNENYDAKFIFWNNDKKGKEENKKLNSKGYLWVNIPDEYGVKDPSDLIKKLGVKEGQKILKQELIKKGIL